MLTRKEMETFASEWIAAWNAHDLPRVLSDYSSDVEFSSPFITKVVDEPSGRLCGKEALQAYWTKALARLPAL
jgi:ketosteroid isomerase-like protein